MEQTSNLLRPRADNDKAKNLSLLSRRTEMTINGVKVVFGLWKNLRIGLPETPHLFRAAKVYIRAPDGSLIKTIHDVDVLACHGKRARMGPLTAFDGQPIDEVVRTLRGAGHNVDVLAVCNEIGGEETSSPETNSDIEALEPPVIYSKDTKVNVTAGLDENATIVVGLQPSDGGKIVYEQFEQYKKVPVQ